MRKKVLGTLAALAVSAGGALGQSPSRMPLPAGPGDGAMPARMANQPMLPPGGYGEMPVPNVDPNALQPNGLPPGGLPTYPNGGAYGQTPYDSPALERNGLFGHGRGAANASVWFEGSYLLMFPKSQPVGFPLLTTSSPADAGVVGLPTTSILQGGSNLSLGNASGFRLSGGYFRPSDQRIGVEFGGMYLAPVSNIVYASSNSLSNGVPVIARPFIDTGAGGSSLLASFPTFAFGSALSRATTKFYGAEVNSLVNLYRTAEGDSRHWVLNFVAGFRFAQLAEEIDVTSRATLLEGNTASNNGISIAAPTSLEVNDHFRTRNSFYGGQAGLQSQFNSGRWYVGVSGKVGVGVIHQEIEVSGSTNASNAETRATSNSVGGLFANASNIGSYRSDEFGILTDLNATLGYQITPWLIATAGYNFIHMNTVARPGNLFDGRVDGSIIPASNNFGGASSGSPPLITRRDDFFVHGLNFGFILRY